MSDWHGVNGQPPFVVEDQQDDLKKIPGLVWPDDEETVGRIVIAEVVDNELVFDGMVNVAIDASVLAGRRVDLHGSQS